MNKNVVTVFFKVHDPDSEELNRYYEILTEDMKLELCAPWYIDDGYYVFPIRKRKYKNYKMANLYRNVKVLIGIP